MIKLLFKHIIYELCINRFFDSVFDNFPVITIDNSELQIGDYINVSVLFNNNKVVLYGCRVDSKQGDLTILIYDGFDTPITLIAQNGELIDVRGDFDTVTDNFI